MINYYSSPKQRKKNCRFSHTVCTRHQSVSHVIHEVQGIRLKKASVFSSHQKSNDEAGTLVKSKNVIIGVEEIENFQNEKRRLSSKKSKRSHWLPKIHEDYYGPRHHRARHH
ncbi:hypothetical protein Leryth_001364 [Lithospermum erythrorhizon]|nr:hypothetical protein Leryth_001364 [Lithospermum erythrorhizon]